MGAKDKKDAKDAKDKKDPKDKKDKKDKKDDKNKEEEEADDCDNEQARLSTEPCPDQHTSEACSMARPETPKPRRGVKVYDACPKEEKPKCPTPVDPCALDDDQKERIENQCSQNQNPKKK